MYVEMLGDWGGMITVSSLLCIFKLSPSRDTLRQECDYINKLVSGANGCELPHNNTTEFSTLEISFGTGIPYYGTIKRTKLPASTTKPPFDRASGLFLMVAIKALGGVFLQGLADLRLPQADHPPAQPGCSGGVSRYLLAQPAIYGYLA